jgi:hypothetical protein
VRGEETPLRTNISSLLREAGSDASANTSTLDSLARGVRAVGRSFYTPLAMGMPESPLMAYERARASASAASPAPSSEGDRKPAASKYYVAFNSDVHTTDFGMQQELLPRTMSRLRNREDPKDSTVFLNIDQLAVNSPGRRGSSLQNLPPEDVYGCTLWLYSPKFDEDGYPTHGLCFGKIGRQGKVCLETATDCPVAAHKKQKFQPVPETYYLVNPDGQLVDQPCFDAALYEGNPIFEQFRTNRLHPQGWLRVQSLLHAQVDIEGLDIKEVKEDTIAAITRAQAAPTPYKRLKLADIITTDPGELPNVFQEEVSEALREVETTLNNAVQDLGVLSSRVGTSAEGGKTVWEQVQENHRLAYEAQADSKAALQVGRVAHEKAVGADHALATAQKALAMEPQVLSLLDRVAALERQLVTERNARVDADATLTRTAAELKDVIQLVGDLMNLVTRPGGASMAGPGAVVAAGATQGAEHEALKAEVAALRAEIQAGLKSMRLATKGEGPLRIGTVELDTLKSCEEFCRAHQLDKRYNFELFTDPLSFLACLNDATTTLEQFTNSAILTTKTDLSPLQLKVAASFESQIPELFAGASKGGAAEAAGSRRFGNIKKYSDWDSGDGETGVRNYVRTASRNLLEHLVTHATTKFDHEDAVLSSFLATLHQMSHTAVLEFVEAATELQKHLAFQSFGDVCLGDSQQAECWAFVLVFIDVYCKELSQARIVARSICSNADFLQANSLALHAAVRAHQVHQTFKSFMFREHPKIFPKFQTQFIQKCVRKADVEEVLKSAKTLKETVAKLSAAQGTLKDTVSRLETKVGRIEGGGGRGKRKAGGGNDTP